MIGGNLEFIEVTDESSAEQLIKICPDVIAIDTEYVPGNPRTTKLTSVILADEDKAWIISPSLLPMLTPMIRARKLIFLQDWQHCDTMILHQHGCDLRETLCYNLIDMYHLIDENKSAALGNRVLDTFNDDYKQRLKGQFDNLEYQGKDGIYTYRLGMLDLKELGQKGLLDLYEHVRRTSLALLDTELQGIVVDELLIRRTYEEMQSKIRLYLPKLREDFKHACTIWELNKWTEEINKRRTDRGKSGVPRPGFSFASDKQLSWLLYEYLQIPVTEKTKTGNPSTSFETLQSYVKDHPKLQTIVDYKETKAVFSTFVEGMLERVENGRIYPHFNVSGTDTGRISHSDPNMGNLPTDGVIRNFFLPSKGCSIIGADYTQLEVIVEANLTNDPNLVRIITEGVSKHNITAEGLGIDRNTAKTLNFALQYGAGVSKVARILGVNQQEAASVYKRYWELYSGVRTLKEKTNKELEEKGQVTNMFGRTRHFPKANGHWELERQKRQAYNFLIQGVAGDACNRALWQFQDWLKVNNFGRVLFSVHDEIVCEVKTEQAEYCKQYLEYYMEAITEYLKFKYPLKSKSYGPLAFWSKT